MPLMLKMRNRQIIEIGGHPVQFSKDRFGHPSLIFLDHVPVFRHAEKMQVATLDAAADAPDQPAWIEGGPGDRRI